MLLNTCNISVKYHWVFVNGLKRKKERKEGRKIGKGKKGKKRERKKEGKKEIFLGLVSKSRNFHRIMQKSNVISLSFFFFSDQTTRKFLVAGETEFRQVHGIAEEPILPFWSE